jgi:hypothetical protein
MATNGRRKPAVFLFGDCTFVSEKAKINLRQSGQKQEQEIGAFYQMWGLKRFSC